MGHILKLCAVVMMLLAAGPVLAQEMQQSDDLINQMKTTLDLQPNQVAGITPIIQRYVVLLANLQKSVNDGTMNPSAVASQRQQLEATETQELSQYLQPYQLSEWRSMQAQMDQQGTGSGNGDTTDSAQYSNYPQGNTGSQ